MPSGHVPLLRCAIVHVPPFCTLEPLDYEFITAFSNVTDHTLDVIYVANVVLYSGAGTTVRLNPGKGIIPRIFYLIHLPLPG